MDSKIIGEQMEEKLNEFKKVMENMLSGFQVQMKAEIKAFFSERLESMEGKLAEIEKAQQFQSDQYDSFRVQVGNVLRVNTELKNENEQLLRRIRDLEKRDKQRVKAIDDLEQYGRREMIEIAGFPRSDDENCENLVLQLADKVGVELDTHGIEACHRISSKAEAPIIVKLSSRKKREQFMWKTTKEKARKLKTTDFGFTVAAGSQSKKIFINESLTQRNKNLLRLAKIKKTELDYKYVWSRNGVIYMRKEDSSPPIKVNYTSDLNKLE